ncbi:hypothetical protein ACVGW4_00310, partial [Enterobacter hormaechei]
VMMTAVSFIIGVLALMLGPPAGAHSPPIIGPNVLIGKLVANQVGINLKNALFIILKPHPELGHPHKQKNPPKKH